MCQKEWFKFCLDIKNNEALPLDPTYPNCLNVWSLDNLSLVSKCGGFWLSFFKIWPILLKENKGKKPFKKFVNDFFLKAKVK
jgi:hypothetical protein